MMAFVRRAAGLLLRAQSLVGDDRAAAVCFTLFRPHFWMDLVAPPFRVVPAAEIVKVIDATPRGGSLRFRIETTDIVRRSDEQDRAAQARREGDARARLAGPGSRSPRRRQPVLASVRPGSEAARLKLRPGDKVGVGQRAERTAEPVLVRRSRR